MGASAQRLSRLPPRHEIANAYLADETALVDELIPRARFADQEKQQVEEIAADLVKAARDGRREFGGVDRFTSEYGLTNEEGVMLMCLAEALLRIPDAETADKFIADKILGGDWERHLGRSESLLVNASTWGLMLTGRVIQLGNMRDGGLAAPVKRMVARSGEPVIREAMRHAMRVLGEQFVLGRTIGEAIARGKEAQEQGYRFSYDMLGEAALTQRDADLYFERYVEALEAVAAHMGKPAQETEDVLHTRPSLSVKLSALHPRFEPAHEKRVRREAGPRLLKLARLARENWLGLTIDAEEADRLGLTLQLFGDLLADAALDGWNGLGIAVQAYGKRASATIDWLAAVARRANRRIPVRLVKGAYWDTEIKFAQQQGLADYPLFTRKANTDICYLACVRKLLAAPQAFFPQFATHNAHTIAAVSVMSSKAGAYEFQRLHGMGEALYQNVIAPEQLAKAARIYAPVGGHANLLAYLVRRLLENGANTSFVNRLADDELPISEIITDPVDRVAGLDDKRHPGIPKPPDLYEPHRKNSSGVPHWDTHWRLPLIGELDGYLTKPVLAAPIVSGKIRAAENERAITSPHDNRVDVGRCGDISEGLLKSALAAARAAAPEWDRRGGPARAEILEKAADLIEVNRAYLMAVMIREAGKTIPNALGEVREAADFLRYYASEARRMFAAGELLKGPTGERNQYTLAGRGAFGCISPWNFPLAIFIGQVAAALAAGNTVVAKPAEQTPLTAFLAVQYLLQAGLPPDVLHLAPGPGATIGAALVADARCDGVVFTGSNETAAAISRQLAARQGALAAFIAETGGINAMIVDSSALPEQVARDVIASAFDSAGQRCSALRVLFLQDDVADPMIAMILGAMEELQIGDPFDYATDIGPVIDADAKVALDAHKARMRGQARELIELSLPPASRYGTYVAPAVYEIPAMAMLEREVFGPILHIVRYQAERLEEVVEAINASGYGLTLGLHSRIEETADFVARRARVGNLYINRNQIGAVVGVQPFGGMGLSGTGPKAGGPHYLPRFAIERVRTTDLTAGGGDAALLSLRPDRDTGR